MKRFFSIAALLLLCVIATGCPDKPDDSDPKEKLDITGEWQLTQLTTKAVQVGDQTVDVYIAFTSAGNFDLYQMLGTGRYRHYTGFWTLIGETLTGSYTGGASWASSYTVSLDQGKTQLVLITADGSEVHTYRKQSIPQDVTANAVEP